MTIGSLIGIGFIILMVLAFIFVLCLCKSASIADDEYHEIEKIKRKIEDDEESGS